MPRCPNGTRKNKQGDCEKIEKEEEKKAEKEEEKKAEKEEKKEETIYSCIQQCLVKHKTPTPVPTPVPSPVISKEKIPSPKLKEQPKKKRCPKGTYRNKEGNCVAKKSLKKSSKLSSSSSISRLESADTPRKVYVKKYLTHPVKLLGNKYLFQVSFTNPDQFTNYKKITGSEKTGYECFIQTLFSLGLRDRKAAKDDLHQIKIHNIGGIPFTKAAKYFENSFGLNPGQIKHDWLKKVFKHDEFKNYVSSTLKRQLENNHATIITISIVNRTVENSKGVGHYIIVYKYNNILYYFDPQDNTTTTDPNNILENKQYYIRSYGSFQTYKVLKSTDLVNNNCQLEYVIGGW